ncbi:hypothetical protein PCANC_09034 [Puccinia coronata f. sp. avenae]|uniref:Response regulatory domain-containing protein n=1 Tax=Puccinia coronata f. sp. avenae TaxID=200324 RepID=A0A2N5T226_9BASI|nr:hypothetical protein PCANC_09034 [Puccinia coronata f. sp. avenae]
MTHTLAPVGSTAPQRVQLKVLIVDDNTLNLRVMRQLLKTKLSHFLDLDALQTASSGLEALDLLDNYPFHLLFLDISMPGISGLEVCRRLRTGQHPPSKLHICAVTTDLADWQVQLYKDFGMDGVIGKPLKNHDLEFALQACLESIISQPHLDPPLQPAFYFLRHGSHQPLPRPETRPLPDSVQPAESPHSPSSTLTSTETLSISCISLPPLLSSCSRANSSRNGRQQSVVSDTSVASVIAYEDTPTLLRFPPPCFDQLEMVDELLLPDCRPSFDLFDTSSATDSIVTCSSSGPNSAAALDPLSPSFAPEDEETFEHARCFPAFPTAPILTFTHVPIGQRSPRRWSSPLYTLSSPSGDVQLPREENDVFAAGFQAAIDQACSRWGENCISATFPCAHDTTYGSHDHENSKSTVTPKSWSDEEEEQQGPVASNDSDLSSVRRQLISRRSHPILRLHQLDGTPTSASESTLTEFGGGDSSSESPFMRKSKSAAGLPIRPSWQLVQLSAINYQSVLKSGTLLDEVLLGLDLEDDHHLNI